MFVLLEFLAQKTPSGRIGFVEDPEQGNCNVLSTVHLK
jgi:hypothetical protein